MKMITWLLFAGAINVVHLAHGQQCNFIKRAAIKPIYMEATVDEQGGETIIDLGGGFKGIEGINGQLKVSRKTTTKWLPLQADLVAMNNCSCVFQHEFTHRYKAEVRQLGLLERYYHQKGKEIASRLQQEYIQRVKDCWGIQPSKEPVSDRGGNPRADTPVRPRMPGPVPSATTKPADCQAFATLEFKENHFALNASCVNNDEVLVFYYLAGDNEPMEADIINVGAPGEHWLDLSAIEAGWQRKMIIQVFEIPADPYEQLRLLTFYTPS
ncbi:MAG: hypothetical protein AAF828_10860 [Bacteroidota bacterium]